MKRSKASRRTGRRPIRLTPAQNTIAKQSAAALALGLGLAAAGPSEAAVVYTSVNQTIANNLEPFPFLEFDGLPQFNAYHYNSSPYAGAMVGAPSGGIVFNNNYDYYAARLNLGTPINSSSTFYTNGWLAYTLEGFSYGGDWLGKTGYLGLQFYGEDGVHYGWAKLGVPQDLSFLKLYGFAYEDGVDIEILAGAGDPNAVPLPGSLALLASGAAGLLGYRRMRKAA